MTCEKADFAIQIMGLEEHPIENIKIINSTFKNIKKENVVESVKGLIIEGVIINDEKVNTES